MVGVCRGSVFWGNAGTEIGAGDNDITVFSM